jgi:hypothetical protein
MLPLLLEHHLLREAAASELVLGGVIVVNEWDVVAVELVLIWVGQSRTYGTIWVCARVRVQGGAGLEELKSGRVLAKAVRSAFGNVLW